jgi:hypothetical protein
MTTKIPHQTGQTALLTAIIVLLMSACAQTSVVDSWKTDRSPGNKPSKVAVIVVLPDALIRKAIEADVVKILRDRGIPAVAGSSIPGLSGGIRGEIDVDVATELLRTAEADGIIAMFYAGSGKSESYVRSDYWAEHVGSAYVYNWARPYFVNVYTIHQGPGWADFKTSAFVESIYYDLESREPIWRIVTETKDTEHTDTAVDIAKKIASQMKSAGLN